MGKTNFERGLQKQNAAAQDSFKCAPGTCGEYSSSNYWLLGLMLSQLAGAKHWTSYDQSAFLPKGVRSKMPQTVFALRGRCSEFTDVHGYSSNSDLKARPDLGLFDNHDSSCGNLFTVGNALSTGKETAIFMRHLLGKDEAILQPQTKAEMMKLRWLEGSGKDAGSGQFYGLGLRDLSAQLIMQPLTSVLNPEIFMSGLLLGHDGTSTGFNSFNAYAPRRDFAMSFITNTDFATAFFNFIARKTYDITSAITTPIDSPLQATYHNTDAFLNQRVFKTLRLGKTPYVAGNSV